MPELLSYLTGDKVTAAVLLVVAVFYLVKFILHLRKQLAEAHLSREQEHERCCKYRVKLERARGQIQMLKYIAKEDKGAVEVDLPEIPDLREHLEEA